MPSASAVPCLVRSSRYHGFPPSRLAKSSKPATSCQGCILPNGTFSFHRWLTHHRPSVLFLRGLPGTFFSSVSRERHRGCYISFINIDVKLLSVFLSLFWDDSSTQSGVCPSFFPRQTSQNPSRGDERDTDSDGCLFSPYKGCCPRLRPLPWQIPSFRWDFRRAAASFLGFVWSDNRLSLQDFSSPGLR